MKEMVLENPEHGHEMLEDALNAVFADDLDDGRLLLRSYINATIGFSELGRVLEKDPEALKHALGSKGNPAAATLFEIVYACAEADDLKITTHFNRARISRHRMTGWHAILPIFLPTCSKRWSRASPRMRPKGSSLPTCRS
jgi:DNA-binding phage protein